MIQLIKNNRENLEAKCRDDRRRRERKKVGKFEAFKNQKTNEVEKNDSYQARPERTCPTFPILNPS